MNPKSAVIPEIATSKNAFVFGNVASSGIQQKIKTENYFKLDSR
jgi:hypothetical protein